MVIIDNFLVELVNVNGECLPTYRSPLDEQLYTEVKPDSAFYIRVGSKIDDRVCCRVLVDGRALGSFQTLHKRQVRDLGLASSSSSNNASRRPLRFHGHYDSDVYSSSMCVSSNSSQWGGHVSVTFHEESVCKSKGAGFESTSKTATSSSAKRTGGVQTMKSSKICVALGTVWINYCSSAGLIHAGIKKRESNTMKRRLRAPFVKPTLVTVRVAGGRRAHRQVEMFDLTTTASDDSFSAGTLKRRRLNGDFKPEDSHMKDEGEEATKNNQSDGQIHSASVAKVDPFVSKKKNALLRSMYQRRTEFDLEYPTDTKVVPTKVALLRTMYQKRGSQNSLMPAEMEANMTNAISSTTLSRPGAFLPICEPNQANRWSAECPGYSDLNAGLCQTRGSQNSLMPTEMEANMTNAISSTTLSHPGAFLPICEPNQANRWSGECPGYSDLNAGLCQKRGSQNSLMPPELEANMTNAISSTTLSHPGAFLPICEPNQANRWSGECPGYSDLNAGLCQTRGSQNSLMPPEMEANMTNAISSTTLSHPGAFLPICVPNQANRWSGERPGYSDLNAGLCQKRGSQNSLMPPEMEANMTNAISSTTLSHPGAFLPIYGKPNQANRWSGECPGYSDLNAGASKTWSKPNAFVPGPIIEPNQPDAKVAGYSNNLNASTSKMMWSKPVAFAPGRIFDPNQAGNGNSDMDVEWQQGAFKSMPKKTCSSKGHRAATMTEPAPMFPANETNHSKEAYQTFCSGTLSKKLAVENEFVQSAIPKEGKMSTNAHFSGLLLDECAHPTNVGSKVGTRKKEVDDTEHSKERHKDLGATSANY